VRALLHEHKVRQPVLRRSYGTTSDVLPGQIANPQLTAFENALNATGPRNTWTREEIKEIYETPLMKLAFAAVSRLVTN